MVNRGIELLRLSLLCGLMTVNIGALPALATEDGDPLISEATRSDLQTEVARWAGARWFYQDAFYRRLFASLKRHGVYPSELSYEQASAGNHLFSLGRTLSKTVFRASLASAGLEGILPAPDFRNNPVLSIQADGHTVTYFFKHDPANRGRYLVDRVVEHGKQATGQGILPAAQALLIYDRQDPEVAREAAEYRVRRKLELCEWESVNVRAIVRDQLDRWRKRTKDPAEPLPEAVYESLFSSLQKEGLFRNLEYDRRYFASSFQGDPKKHGELALVVAVPRHFQSDRIKKPRELGDDLLSFHYGLSGEGIRVLTWAPVNCAIQERRRLEHQLTELEHNRTEVLTHGALPLLPTEAIRSVAHHY